MVRGPTPFPQWVTAVPITNTQPIFAYCLTTTRKSSTPRVAGRDVRALALLGAVARCSGLARLATHGLGSGTCPDAAVAAVVRPA